METSPEEAAALTEVQRQIIDVELRFDYAKKNRKTPKAEGVDVAPFDAEVARWEAALKALKETKLFEGPIATGVRDAGLWINGDDPAWTLLDYHQGRPRDLRLMYVERGGEGRRAIVVALWVGAEKGAIENRDATSRHVLALGKRLIEATRSAEVVAGNRRQLAGAPR